MNKENSVGIALSVVGGLVIVIGVIAFCMTMAEAPSIAFTALLSSAALGVLLLGMGEIVKLLQQIASINRSTAMNTKLTCEVVDKRLPKS